MSSRPVKEFTGHCSGCDRDVEAQLPTAVCVDDWRALIRCADCETSVPCRADITETGAKSPQREQAPFLVPPDAVVCDFPGEYQRGAWGGHYVG